MDHTVITVCAQGEGAKHLPVNETAPWAPLPAGSGSSPFLTQQERQQLIDMKGGINDLEMLRNILHS